MARASKVGNTVDNVSDANFRAWGKFVDDSMIAGGWVHTADAGQINFATVLAPAGANASQGYVMYQSQDAGVGQNNYFVKIEFGSGAVASRPAMYITVGWATDGAGNIVTTSFPSSTRTQITNAAAAAGTPVQNASANGNAANGAGYMCWACAQNSASLSWSFSIERTRNADLTFKDQVLIILGNSATFASICQVVDRNNAYPTFIGSTQTPVLPPSANTPIAGIAALGLMFGLAPGLTSPSLCWFGTEANAIGRIQDVVTVPILAVDHTYVILDGTQFSFSVIIASFPMMRYE